MYAHGRLDGTRESGDIRAMTLRAVVTSIRGMGFLVLLAFTADAHAAEPALLLKAIPSATTSATPAADTWELLKAEKVIARFPALSPALRRGTPRVQTSTIEGHPIAEVRIPIRGRSAEEVWIGDLRTVPAQTIWNGLTGPRDADEEASTFVEATAERIFEFQTAAQVSRCDGEAVQLFPRAWDFASRRFRPIVSNVPVAATTTITAHRGDPAMPTTRPLGGVRFTAASTTNSAGSDARALTAPNALNDGDPATIWSEGLGGDGRGEFLTARASAGQYRVRGLRIRPGDTTSPTAFKNRNRLKSITIAYGAAPKQRIDVDFPVDPAAAPADYRAPYWIPFPEPVETSCLTVVIREVYRGAEPGPASAGTTAIADLEIFTDVDSPAGLDRLIADTAAGGECQSRIPLLANLGDAAVLPLAQAILAASGARSPSGVTASAAGRECLVTALTALPEATKSAIAVDASVAALHGATSVEEKLLLGWMKRLPRPPVEAVAHVLRDPNASEADQKRAARVLAEFDVNETSDVLLAQIGRGTPDVRLALIQALGQSKALTVTRIEEALRPLRGSADAASTAREADLIRTIPAAVAHSGADRTASLATALVTIRGSLVATRPYETQARALAALGALGDSAAVGDLARVRAESPDPVLRFLAARELGAFASPDAQTALRLALTDGDPRVRETAAQGMGLVAPTAANAASENETALVTAAKNEPWPFARRAQVEAVSRICGTASLDLLQKAMERDVDEVRRVALLGLVRCRDPRAETWLLGTLKARNASATLRELAAGLMGDLPNLRDAPGALNAGIVNNDARRLQWAKTLAEQVLALVNEAEGDLAVEGVATSALRSLGSLGGPDAARIAAGLAKDRRHPYRRAAIDVLGQICDRGEGNATLTELAALADPELSMAAQSAIANCRDKAPGRAVRSDKSGSAPSAAPGAH